MSKRKKPEVTQFELDLSISIGQEMRGEVKATTPEQITVRRRRAGRPVQEVHKQPVTLRLDPEVLARQREGLVDAGSAGAGFVCTHLGVGTERSEHSGLR